MRGGRFQAGNTLCTFKLKNTGIPIEVYNWMNSYLTYRSQRGRVNNRNSDFLNMSIIRLLLLLLLLNINIFMGYHKD